MKKSAEETGLCNTRQDMWDGIPISRLMSVGAVVPLGHCPFDPLHLETQNKSTECLKAMSSKNEHVLPLRARFWVQE